MKFRTFIILLFLVGAVVISYRYSDQVYGFYLKTYYIRFLKKNKEDMIKPVLKLIDKKDQESQEKLQEYLIKLTLLYPDDKIIMYYNGINLIRLGDPINGAHVVVSSLNGFKADEAVINEVVTILYTNKYYTDIIYILDKYPGKNKEIIYYYGVSLFIKEKYQKAIDVLKQVRNAGKYRFIAHLYIGDSYVKLQQYKKALPYLEVARTYDKRNELLNRSLITVYTKLGKLEKAEAILRFIK